MTAKLRPMGLLADAPDEAPASFGLAAAALVAPPADRPSRPHR